MGKMKALLTDREEENIYQEEQEEYDVVMEEAHYHHVVNDFVSLIEVYGWEKVIGDLREKMGNTAW
jgi:hypothetical protein